MALGWETVDGPIAYQGEPGANSAMACTEMFPDREQLPCTTFEDALEAVSTGRAGLAMIPVDNSIMRPGRGHPSLAAGLRATHHRRVLPAHPLPVDGRAGLLARGDHDRSQPRARARPVPQDHP